MSVPEQQVLRTWLQIFASPANGAATVMIGFAKSEGCQPLMCWNPLAPTRRTHESEPFSPVISNDLRFNADVSFPDVSFVSSAAAPSIVAAKNADN